MSDQQEEQNQFDSNESWEDFSNESLSNANEQEEQKIVEVDENLKGVSNGCKHYQRYCSIQAPCCKIFYPCRFCHDEQYKGVKGPGCLVEHLDRQAITLIKCNKCGCEQPPQQNCQQCHIQFAHYFCPICKLFDNTPGKQIYHCDKCGICRIGVKEENFHCDKCNACFKLNSQHKCNEDHKQMKCPICFEEPYFSQKDYTQLSRCNHWIHVSCLNGYLKSGGKNCPICNKTIIDDSKYDYSNLDKIIEQTRPHLPKELQKNVKIICNNCQQVSEEVPYHVYGMKCPKCGSYDTKE